MHCNSNMDTSAKSLHIMLVTETGTTEIQMHKTIKQARHNRGTCTATATWAPQQRVYTSCWSQKQPQHRQTCTIKQSSNIMLVTKTCRRRLKCHTKSMKASHSKGQASNTNRQQQSMELNGKK